MPRGHGLISLVFTSAFRGILFVEVFKLLEYSTYQFDKYLL